MGLRSMAGWWGLGLLAGCAGIGDLVKEPDVRLDRVLVRSVTLSGGTLDLVVEIENPNPFDLRGTELELGFDVEGSHVGDLRFTQDFSVTEGDRTTLPLPLSFEWAGVGSALRTALSQGEIPYEMKGQVKLQTPFGPRSVAFTKSGRAPLMRPGGRSPIPASP